MLFKKSSFIYKRKLISTINSYVCLPMPKQLSFLKRADSENKFKKSRLIHMLPQILAHLIYRTTT